MQQHYYHIQFPVGWQERVEAFGSMLKTEDVEAALQFITFLVGSFSSNIVCVCNWIDIYLLPAQREHHQRRRAVEKLCRKVLQIDPARRRCIFFPICENLHFSLIVVDFVNRRICVADSLLHYHDNAARVDAVQWFVHRHFGCGDVEWTIEKSSRVVQLYSTVNCGVMVCMFASNLLLDKPLEWCVTDANTIRMRFYLIRHFLDYQ